MQKYQDTATGTEWHFDEGVDVSTLSNVPKTLTDKIIPRPSEYHDWASDGWILNRAAFVAANNSRVTDEIAVVENNQIRPTRELLIDPGNVFARNKLAALEAEIIALRARLL